MKAYDLAELAVRNLRESVLRNSLTTIGISVGVASLVAMLSLGIGLQQLASKRLRQSGLFDTVVVTSRREMRHFGRDEQNGPAPAESPALDEAARKNIEKLPNVLEAYPDIRFITELRYEDKPHLTMVAGLPFSARENDAFQGIQGGFFSSDAAPEVILQKAFAEELLGIKRPPGSEEANVATLAKALLGKDLVMRYAERMETPASSSNAKPAADEDVGASYSVVSREQRLRIVGICDLDPDSLRGAAHARSSGCMCAIGVLRRNSSGVRPNTRGCEGLT